MRSLGRSILISISTLILGMLISKAIVKTTAKYYEIRLFSAKLPDLSHQFFDLKRDYHQTSVKLALNPWNRESLFCILGKKLKINLLVENLGPMIIESIPGPGSLERKGINLSYRIFEPNIEAAIHEGKRYPLKKQLGMEEALIDVHCPPNEGVYELRVELVSEGWAWMSSIEGARFFNTQLHAILPHDFDPTLFDASPLDPEVEEGEEENAVMAEVYLGSYFLSTPDANVSPHERILSLHFQDHGQGEPYITMMNKLTQFFKEQSQRVRYAKKP